MDLKKLRGMFFSATAKDTFVLFGGNVASAFWGFVFTLIVARAMSVEDFGVFSAALNLATILISLSDIGITTGLVGFVSRNEALGNFKVSNEFVKASFIIRLISVVVVSLVLIIFAKSVSFYLLASSNFQISIFTALLCVFMFPNSIFPFVLQAKRKFLESTIVDNSYFILRLVAAYVIIKYGILDVNYAILTYGAGFIVSIILGLIYLKTNFIFSKPKYSTYEQLLKFSGWIGVNRIVSSVSGRLDIQMLAVMAGATATGIYSIPSRLASFIIVLAASFSSVLATRLSSFRDKDLEKKYIIKSTLALIPIVALVVLWIIFARPFVLILFGEKYTSAIPVFQALAIAQIPFLFTVPPVTAIIYAMRKTIYIGLLSFFQLGGIFILNFILIPKYGYFGPTITFGVTNTILAIYVWIVVIKYYSKNKLGTKAQA